MMASARAAIDEQITAAMAADVVHGHRRECLGLRLPTRTRRSTPMD
jgi:hypothetical protein